MIVQKTAERGRIGYDVQSQIPPHGTAMHAYLLERVLDEIGRNGKTDTRITFFRIGENRFVDTDDFPANVDERPAGIAGKDAGIRLNQIQAGIHQLAFPGADDAA